MAEDPNAIAIEIQGQRARLGRHVQELEAKLHEATDWRAYLRRKPLVTVAAAFSVGLGLSLLLSGRRS
jgi:ElaB/YqjD/DUF883 family membrane-anchored ribosome-binding protein